MSYMLITISPMVSQSTSFMLCCMNRLNTFFPCNNVINRYTFIRHQSQHMHAQLCDKYRFASHLPFDLKLHRNDFHSVANPVKTWRCRDNKQRNFIRFGWSAIFLKTTTHCNQTAEVSLARNENVPVICILGRKIIFMLYIFYTRTSVWKMLQVKRWFGRRKRRRAVSNCQSVCVVSLSRVELNEKCVVSLWQYK